MAPRLTEQATRAALRKQIAEDRLAASRAEFAYKAYQNDNLKQSRKRKLGWTTVGTAERDFPTSDRLRAMAMARQRVEENPLYATIQRARLDHIIGVEHRLMMRTGDRAWDKEVESWWKGVKDKLDIRGTRRFGRLQRCWQAREDIDGDFGVILVTDGSRNEWVQTIEADRIRRIKAEENGHNDGLEFDQYGMPVGFWVVDSTTEPKREKKYDREDFVFSMRDDSERAERRRGMSLYVTTFNLGEDQLEIRDGMVQKVKNESFMGLFFRMDAAESGTLFGAQQASGTAENGSDYSKVKLLPNTNIVGGPGEHVDVLETKSPNAQYVQFDKLLEARIAFAAGMAYELITGDFSGINYSSARALIEIVKKRIRCEQADADMTASRIFQWKLSRAIKRGDIKAPDKLKTWWNHKWGVPSFPYLNPAQEANAMRQLIEARLASREMILADNGNDDFDEVADELAYEEAGLKERGLPSLVQSGSQAMGQPAQDAASDMPLQDGQQ